MTTIRPIDPTHADAQTQKTLAGVKAKLGVLPNMVLTMAQSPAALASYLQLAGAVAGGSLSAAQREAIALAVAQSNACGYCLAAHTVIGAGAGLSAEAISAARRGSGQTPADAALTALAQRIVSTQGHPSAADIAAFRAAGHSDAVLLEVIANVALNIYTNYVNHIAGTEIDFPVQSLQLAA
ncbi:MAG: carboxymuconolactone decarboxylase family protein [Lysobacterales bacterium]